MSKIAVIYWTMTGNTQAMAEAIADGAKSAGAEVDLFSVSDISVSDALNYDKLALGCPAMGVEQLDDSEFDPFFTELEGHISGKTVALFGSYGWGDGQWMRDWQDRVVAAGGNVYQDEGLIVNEAPDDTGLADCRSFGAGYASV